MERGSLFAAEVHAFLRANAGPDAPRVGPFTLRFDDHSDERFFNYAIPDDGAAPAAGEVEALVAAFRERERTPRLEYVPRAAPKVEGALLSAGFTPEGRFPLLVCSPGDVVDAPADPSVRVSLAGAGDDLWGAARVMDEAFGSSGTTEHDVARLRRIVEGGGLVAVAVDTATGAVVGAGQNERPHRGVAEVASIGVLPSHRRRGIAGAITALLTRAGGDAGIATSFLTPADDGAARVYVRVGYRKVGEALYISSR